MSSSFLKSSRLPISGTTASVSHSDDLDSGFDDPINHLVGKTPEEKFPRAVHMHRPTFGVVLDLSDSVIEFRNKSVGSGGIAIAISLVRCLTLGDRVGMKSNASSGHRIVRGSGGAPPTKVLSLPGPDLFRRCDA